jgi:hypothetical protein
MRAVHFSRVRGGDYAGRMRSVIRTNPLARAGAAFLVGGLAVLVVHQPVVGLLHALGCTPITPYSHRATQPWGVPVFLSLSFWGGMWTIRIAWILDRLSRGWVYWIGAVCLGAVPPTLTTWFVIFPLKGLSLSNAAASVGAVNALVVNGIWGLAFAFAWSQIFVVPRLTATTAAERSRTLAL